MKASVLIFSTFLSGLLLFASFSVNANEQAAAQLCKSIIKTGSPDACITFVTTDQKKCTEKFSAAIKDLDMGKQAGLIKMLEGTKALTICSTDVSIAAVKKFFK